MHGPHVTGRLIGLMAVCAMALLAAVPLAMAQGADTAGTLAGCRELVANGGFEQEGQGWVQAAQPPGRLLITDFYWKSGQYAADLGGVNNATDRLSQVITLPVDVTQVTLTYWWALQTEEAGAAFDRLSVELYELDGTTRVATLLAVDNTTAESWVLRSPRRSSTMVPCWRSRSPCGLSKCGCAVS